MSFSIDLIFILFIFLMVLAQCVSALLSNRKIERKLDKIYLEVRDLNLRLTIVETRMEERAISKIPQLTDARKKRGRPPKQKEA